MLFSATPHTYQMESQEILGTVTDNITLTQVKQFIDMLAND